MKLCDWGDILDMVVIDVNEPPGRSGHDMGKGHDLYEQDVHNETRNIPT